MFLVYKHQGKTSFWSGYYHAYSLFLNPVLWENTDCLAQYFTPEPSWKPNCFESKGVVIMDLDAKWCWSESIFGYPGSCYFGNSLDKKSGFEEGMKALGSRPDAWGQFHIMCPHEKQGDYSLERIAQSSGQAPKDEVEFLKWMSVDELNPHDFNSFGFIPAYVRGDYLPLGWRRTWDIVGETQTPMDRFKELLEHLDGHGFEGLNQEFFLNTLHRISSEFDEEDEEEKVKVEQIKALISTW